MYFDYDANWQIRESDSIQIDPSMFENELMIPSFPPSNNPSSSAMRSPANH